MDAEAGLDLTLRQHGPIPLDAQINCRPGELVALLGPSGSGKTTILRSIAGLATPDTGHIVCRGETWLDSQREICRPPQQRHAGFVFQDYALFPHLTALQNIMVALDHYPSRERESRARNLLQQVHLLGLDAHTPAELSGGQRQRVALARALAREPSVLLLDEPFSAVDQVTRRKLQQELVLLRRSISVPILLVTHDLQEAASLADRVYVLHRGRTLQSGPPHEVMARPLSSLVARLMDIGNIFTGYILSHDEKNRLTRVDWQGTELHLPYRPGFAEGEKVEWMIPGSHIVMHRVDRPSRGERENPVSGTITELVSLGENTNVTLRVHDHDNSCLFFHVATHSARRNQLAIGGLLSVSLLSEGLHLMKPLQAD